jgi:hypothetical protein
MIFGDSGIKFTRDFRPTRRDFRLTRIVFADDAIHAQGTKSDKTFFTKFDSPVLLPKRGHGIEVRIN